MGHLKLATPAPRPEPLAPPAPPVPRRWTRFWRNTGIVVCGLGGLALGSLLLRPFGIYQNRLSRRLEFLKSHPSEVDVLFVGASYTYQQFSPQVFEKRLAKGGVTLRSYNLSHPGFIAPDVDELMALVAQIPFTHLKYIVIDLTAVDLNTHPFTIKQPEFIQVSPPRSVLSLVSLMQWPDLRDRGKQRGFWIRPANALSHFLNIGQGYNSVIARVRPQPPNTSSEPPERKDANDVMSAEDFKNYTSGIQGLTRSIASGECRTNPDRLRPGVRKMMLQWARLFRSRKIEPIFLVAPVPYHFTCNPKLFGKDAKAVIFLNDPIRYPQLFRPEDRYDVNHLKYHMRGIYSEIVADEFLRVIAPGGKS